MVFSFAQDDVLDDERRQLKIAIANQVAQALARARLLEVANAAHARAAFLAEASALLASRSTTSRRSRGSRSSRCRAWPTGARSTWPGRTARSSASRSRTRIRRRSRGRGSSSSASRRTRTSRAARRTCSGRASPSSWPQIPQELLDGVAAERPELAEVIEQLGLRSWICVPLRARGTTLGALSLVAAESGRTFTEADLELALELADRAAVAVDNARLYRESERRGDAARALEYIGGRRRPRRRGRARPLLEPGRGGDHRGARSTARSGAARGCPAGLGDVDRHVVARAAAGRRAPGDVPAAAGRRRALGLGHRRRLRRGRRLRDPRRHRRARARAGAQRLRRDRVARAADAARRGLRRRAHAAPRPTSSSRPRTAAIFLEIIETESERLAAIVEQILLAGQLDAGTVRRHEQRAVDLRRARRRGRRVRAACAPRATSSWCSTHGNVPPSLARRGQAPPGARQPGRERGQVLARRRHRRVAVEHGERLAAASPSATRASASRAAEQRAHLREVLPARPALTRGVGGSGLGLYISRELVDRMGGRSAVASSRAAARPSRSSSGRVTRRASRAATRRRRRPRPRAVSRAARCSSAQRFAECAIRRTRSPSWRSTRSSRRERVRSTTSR